MQPAVSIERLLGLLLALDERRPTSAATLAQRLEVSLRTVYRDVRRLQAAGVPIVAEPGRRGGLLIAPGFRFMPLALTGAETVALAIAVQSLRALPVLPYRAELDAAARKIAAAARVARPELLADIGRWLRVEPPAKDAFHPEREGAPRPPEAVGAVVQAFVDALLAGRSVELDYRSPYARAQPALRLDPAGVIADRGLWYLVGFPSGSLRRARHLRADRVHAIAEGPRIDVARQPDWRSPRARPWLHDAMKAWTAASPATLEITEAQWARLARDWYFSTGTVRRGGPGTLRFTWGEGEFERVRELLAWLGTPARLVEPRAWIGRMRQALADHAAWVGGGG